MARVGGSCDMLHNAYRRVVSANEQTLGINAIVLWRRMQQNSSPRDSNRRATNALRSPAACANCVRAGGRETAIERNERPAAVARSSARAQHQGAVNMCLIA